MRFMALPCACLCMLVLGACSASDDLAPPHVLYGQQECDACRMMISDERFAAALIVEVDGARAALAFDDIACLFDYERTHENAAILKRYVHDVASRQWLDATSAMFTQSATLQTPMGSGIAAVASREGLADLHGVALDFVSLRERLLGSNHTVQNQPNS
jgi:nitrous oxide reductase accessory protein NosL